MKIERPKTKCSIPDYAQKVFTGVIFDVYQWEQELFDGSIATYERLRRPDTVVVFPILPDGRILLTKQSQPGIEDFIGAPGGRVDPGEETFDAVQRELREETGYEADDFVLWKTTQPSNKIDWTIFMFVAKGLKKVGDMQLDPGEKIELFPVDFETFLEIVLDEKFRDQEVYKEVTKASLDKGKKQQLRALFSVN